MTCCVIGGTGFIGRWVTELLLAKGRDVIALGRRPKPPTPLNERARYVCGDYGDRKALRDALQGVKEVIDLAYSTAPQTSFEDPIYDIVSNLPPSVGLLQEALAAGVKKVIVVSSGGTVYGVARELPISEEHPTNPVSPYGITKLTIENYGRMFNWLFDLPVVVVRPSNAYGEGQRYLSGQGFIATAIDRILEDGQIEIYGKAGAIRDYIHVKDVATGIVAALDYGIPGNAYNIGSGEGHSNLDLINLISPLATRAGFQVRTVFRAERKFDVPANVLDSSKLRQISGWRPEVSLEDGISRLWNAMCSARRLTR